jgi:hypothetical protein
MTDQHGARKGGTFLFVFIPGLVVGLIVGGLAGAFLAPILESDAPLNLGKTTPVRANAPGPRDPIPADPDGERDGEPAPGPDAAPKADPKADPKPVEPATPEDPHAPEEEPKPAGEPSPKR